MVKEQKTLDIKTVCECNRCLGSQTLHPLVSLINLESPEVEGNAVKFEFYAILLIEECPDGCGCCGRKYYDFSNATMVFLRPDEIFRMSATNTLPSKGWLLAFHPDLLYRTTLKNHIQNYTFFSYRKEEALHLSQRETGKITCCLENIEEELHHPIDAHTSTILSRHIELMLDYCTRFYERQFITREERNKAMLAKMEHLLGEYIASGKLQTGEMLTTSSMAQQLGLSSAYFSDLLKFETGLTWNEHLQFKVLDEAKRLLLHPKNSATHVAHLLGFANVQRFSLLFKRMTGMSPNDYRFSRN